MTNAEKAKRADLMAIYEALDELNKARLEERALILLEQQTAKPPHRGKLQTADKQRKE